MNKCEFKRVDRLLKSTHQSYKIYSSALWDVDTYVVRLWIIITDNNDNRQGAMQGGGNIIAM